MIEVAVWLLIVTHNYMAGSTVVVDRFQSKEQCDYVKSAMADPSNGVERRCIQANVYIQSGVTK